MKVLPTTIAMFALLSASASAAYSENSEQTGLRSMLRICSNDLSIEDTRAALQNDGWKPLAERAVPQATFHTIMSGLFFINTLNMSADNTKLKESYFLALNSAKNVTSDHFDSVGFSLSGNEILLIPESTLAPSKCTFTSIQTGKDSDTISSLLIHAVQFGPFTHDQIIAVPPDAAIDDPGQKMSFSLMDGKKVTEILGVEVPTTLVVVAKRHPRSNEVTP